MVKKLVLNASGYPEILSRMYSPPKELYVEGDLEDLLARPRVAVIGSRKVSTYGRQVTAQLAGELAKQGIVIVSGLALGVDGLAHQAALDAGGLTLAVLPGSLGQIYPASHRNLARKIVGQGGVLLSEYPDGTDIYRTNFIARNRIVAGISDSVLITEGAEKSGSLHTARFALEQGVEVLAVPGNITSSTSVGTNNLIKAGATPVTSADDVLHALGLERSSAATPVKGDSEAEQIVLDLLQGGLSEGSELLIRSGLSADTFSQTLTMLEITGKARSLGANLWSLR